jgi:hypothetical protein
MMHKSLLVIDWDYFFPNALEGGFNHFDPYLFDWGHAESRFCIDMVWSSRAAMFGLANLPLPEVEPSWKTFPERFNLSEDAVVYIGDSNVWSGNLSDSEGDPFADVWLYDAHHDSGYGVESFGAWLTKHSNEQGGISFSCEDWMLVHHMQGAALHWRFPTWHESFKGRLHNDKCTPECDREGVAHGPFWPEGVDLDARVDDLEPVEEEFDTVYICRSGAWVPPWEDHKFERFYTSWDRDIEQLDNESLIRNFDTEQVIKEVQALRQATEMGVTGA